MVASEEKDVRVLQSNKHAVHESTTPRARRRAAVTQTVMSDLIKPSSSGPPPSFVLIRSQTNFLAKSRNPPPSTSRVGGPQGRVPAMPPKRDEKDGFDKKALITSQATAWFRRGSMWGLDDL